MLLSATAPIYESFSCKRSKSCPIYLKYKMEAKFVCFLEIVGVGFKAVADTEGRKLTLKIGFSHDIELQAPKGIRVFCLGRSSVICCAGTQFERLRQFAATIKRCKPPEIYKGKGIRYRNEIIIRKQGKKK